MDARDEAARRERIAEAMRQFEAKTAGGGEFKLTPPEEKRSALTAAHNAARAAAESKWARAKAMIVNEIRLSGAKTPEEIADAILHRRIESVVFYRPNLR